MINVGDSRAVLAHGGNALPLSNDHKPENPDEKARIEAAGGHVVKYGPVWRVSTPEALAWHQAKIKPGAPPIQPAVARSFGDMSLKTPRLLLTSEPEITVRELQKEDTMLLLGCDGIWDVLDDQVAVNTAAEAAEKGEDPRGIAGSVVKLS